MTKPTSEFNTVGGEKIYRIVISGEMVGTGSEHSAKVLVKAQTADGRWVRVEDPEEAGRVLQRFAMRTIIGA